MSAVRDERPYVLYCPQLFVFVSFGFYRKQLDLEVYYKHCEMVKTSAAFLKPLNCVELSRMTEWCPLSYGNEYYCSVKRYRTFMGLRLCFGK